MSIRRVLKIIIMLLCVCIISAIGLFIYNANHSYNINSNFVSLPLKFNPDDSSSSYSWKDSEITIYGGFVKGIQKGQSGEETLVLRALSPLPSVKIQSASVPADNVSFCIENINPDFYAKSISTGFVPEKTAVNTLNFTISLKADEKKLIQPAQPKDTQNSSYVVLGDSRDGYETFSQIIDRVNAQSPLFVIDNGDLVFSGKPNQYRLFDKMASKFATTMCTTLGNHDIRGNGSKTYKKLYGPNYYSFDFENDHFTFLDSSPGWSQKRAITEEQYSWLERDLSKAKGKRLFVITHIPPEDPRDTTTSNEIPSYTEELEKDNNFLESKLDSYSESKMMNHGFLDKKEARRFETLMEKYKVNTVYLSHIHSFFDYTKNGVRYIISGGAGAELLTENSYYHYLVVKTGLQDSILMVQLPSPTNQITARYIATASLFLQAMYEENTVAVTVFLIGFALLIILIILLVGHKFNKKLSLFWTLIKDTRKFIYKRFKELF